MLIICLTVLRYILLIFLLHLPYHQLNICFTRISAPFCSFHLAEMLTSLLPFMALLTLLPNHKDKLLGLVVVFLTWSTYELPYYGFKSFPSILKQFDPLSFSPCF